MVRKSSLIAASTLIAAVVLLLGAFSFKAYANAPDFNAVSTAAATTTLAYMTPGTASTTLAYVSIFAASDSAVLLTELTASSTSTVLNINVEYAQGGNGTDCSITQSACDWFADNLNGSINSTTSPTKSIQTANSYTWAAASTARTMKAIEIPTPTRYVRVTYTVTGAAAGVWGQLVAKKQQPQ